VPADVGNAEEDQHDVAAAAAAAAAATASLQPSFQ